ncbi:MAG: hypothetical protein MI920_25940, partial [Kiloniellales bacterium]|nr:hypothetical protein [Kiloniellales bacterium]
MTIQITMIPPGTSQTVESGGTVVVPSGEGVVFQIRDVDANGNVGPVIDPSEFETQIVGQDLSVALHDGTIIFFQGFLTRPVEAEGVPIPEGGQTIQSPEETVEPGAGDSGGGTGSTQGSGSIQAANAFFDDGFGTRFGFNSEGVFGPLSDETGFSEPGSDPNLPLLLTGDPEPEPAGAPVPQSASFAFEPAMGLEDEAINLGALVTQNDIEGLGETLAVFIDDIPAGAQILDAAGDVLFTAGPGGGSFATNPAELPTLSIVPPVADDDSDLTLTLRAETFEPSNPGAGVVTVTVALPVVVKAVADKPAITLGDATFDEDNATPIGRGMFADGTPLYPINAETTVVDNDGSESLTQVALDSAEALAVGGLFTFAGEALGDGPIQVEAMVFGGGTQKVTAQVTLGANGITLSFDPADRVQKIDLSDFGIRLPQHKDGSFDVTVTSTSTETHPSEGDTNDPDQVAVASQTQSQDFTLIVGAVADKAKVTAGDVTAKEDNATESGGMHSDGTPTFGTPLSANVADTDGSESITEIRIDGDSLPDGAGFTIAEGPVAFTNGTFLGSGPLQATAAFDGKDLVLTFEAALRLQSIDIGANELGITLPQHKDGSFTVGWQVTATETNPMDPAKVAVASQTQSGSFALTVGAVADKAKVTAGDVTAKEDNATESGGMH